MAEYEYIGDGRPDGTIVSRTATELLGFFGATPVDQPANVAAVATTAVSTAAGTYGFTTAAQGNAVISTLNQILTDLQELGLQASS